jgi:hypothetical protein
LYGDNITNDGALNVTAEPDATIEYSIDSGATWTSAFAAKEGPNTVLVRQTVGGDVSDPTTLSFTLDTAAPAAPGVALANDTGSSSVDGITSDGTVNVTAELGAKVEYSIDSGASWSNTISAVEGPNTVQVRQADLAGNASDIAVLDFTLDSTAPSVPGVALLNDTGSSSLDNITNDGALSISAEPKAKVEYSTDSGATWASAFSAAEGANAVQVRQTDLAGNVSGGAALSLTLDTTPPQLNPTFSSPSPFLFGAQGITVSPNATDAWGVASQSAGTVDTSTVGQKSVTCSATDVAGNSVTKSVPYEVIANPATSYRIVSPCSTYVIQKHNKTIPVWFQLRDANNRLVSDKTAASLLPGITITFDGVPMGSVKYNKWLNAFSAALKIGKQAKGIHNLTIHLSLNGTELATLSMPVKIV